MNKEELARIYAEKKVEERKEYPLLDMRKRKELTSFDGYAIEQAFEDGFDNAIENVVEWLYQQKLALPDIEKALRNPIFLNVRKE